MGNYPDTKRKLEDSSLCEKQQEDSVVELPKKYEYFVRVYFAINIVYLLFMCQFWMKDSSSKVWKIFFYFKGPNRPTTIMLHCVR